MPLAAQQGLKIRLSAALLSTHSRLLNRYLTKHPEDLCRRAGASGMRDAMKRPKTSGMRLPSGMLSACAVCKSKLRQVCGRSNLVIMARVGDRTVSGRSIS